MPEVVVNQRVPMNPKEKQMRRDLRKREILAHCKACGGPLWNKRSAALGYGEYCLRKLVEAGEVRVTNGTVVPAGE